MANVKTDPEALEALNELSKNAKVKDLSLLSKFGSVFITKSAKEAHTKDYVGVVKPLGMFAHRPFLDIPGIKPMSVNSVNQYPTNPSHCRIMERDFFRCLTRVGEQNMRTKCRIYFEDYNECYTNEKALQRKKSMRIVRDMKKQPASMELPAGIV